MIGFGVFGAPSTPSLVKNVSLEAALPFGSANFTVSSIPRDGNNYHSVVAERGTVCPPLQPIQRALDAAGTALQDVGVDHYCRDVGVAKQFLGLGI